MVMTNQRGDNSPMRTGASPLGLKSSNIFATPTVHDKRLVGGKKLAKESVKTKPILV